MPRDARTPEPEPDVPATEQPPTGPPADERSAEEPRQRLSPWMLPEQAEWLDLDEADEADVLEQKLPVGDPALPVTPTVSEHDGAEADILDQSTPVPLDEEDDERR